MTPSAPASTLYHHPSHLPLVAAPGSFVISDGVLPVPVAQLLSSSPCGLQELSFVEQHLTEAGVLTCKFSYETFSVFLKGALFIGGRNMDIMKLKNEMKQEKKSSKKLKRDKENRKNKSDKKRIKGRGKKK